MKIAKVNRSFFLHIPFQQKLNKSKNNTMVHAYNYSWTDVLPVFFSTLPHQQRSDFILLNTFRKLKDFRLWNKSQFKQWLWCYCHFIITILNLYSGFSFKDIHLIQCHPILDTVFLLRGRISSIFTELRVRKWKHHIKENKVLQTGCQ